LRICGVFDRAGLAASTDAEELPLPLARSLSDRNWAGGRVDSTVAHLRRSSLLQPADRNIDTQFPCREFVDPLAE
jgi:hypothetical protein